MLLTHLFETAKKSTVDPRDLVLEQANPEDYDDYEDEDEDLRLRSGDYVRDQQDGESGEIFRMQGDPSGRRVQILDRDGRGWYIAPDRLTRVNPQDPDVHRYFGKKRVRDMDEDLNEFAPGPKRDDDEVPDQLLKLANRWWNATDDQPKITNVLRSLGWSIAQVESEDDAVQLMHDDGTTYFISADDFDPDVFEGWSDAYVARRTGQPRTPYSVYIKGRKWKDFENDDHARAVMDKLKARFKADGRDPSVITIAPTDIPEGVAEDQMDENLRDWFGKEKWVRMDTKGNIKGDCARGSESEGKPKCLPQAKAHALGKKGRAAAAQKKRRQDPNPERRGAAINVATKVKEENQDDRNARIIAGEIEDAMSQGNEKLAQEKIKQLIRVGYTLDKQGRLQRMGMYEQGMAEADLAEACWKGYHKDGMKTMFGKRYPNCVKNKNESLEVYVDRGECPGCGGVMVSEDQINEKQDACYHKVKSRYKVWPSAYASGALVQCRKKGASNWGNSGKNEDVSEAKNLNKRVRVVSTGKTGTIRQIKPGAFKGAPKTYYVDLDNGEQADNLPASALRLIKTQEGRQEVDEVSKDTLGRYIKLAGVDAANRASSSSYKSGAAGDKYNKADPSRQEVSRERGIDRAIKKITK